MQRANIGYAPGFVNVIRKRVTPMSLCQSNAILRRSYDEPGMTLSNTEAIVACKAPSASVVTFPEGVPVQRSVRT